ncbi:hypothetical protein O9H85_29640 [Paenibacillus filicis]|uniref:O-antigen ligase domain-containing protein n=1 Tax=Paenibacillus gyeongsangnamensis TaxID=3388067 RepID=A0ABT4QHV8_9BACL|nr:hypothetical protein [Paenibacillus filicis]MCZ8516477.1 hypothetical protein [Paenibacillus filicis]
MKLSTMILKIQGNRILSLLVSLILFGLCGYLLGRTVMDPTKIRLLFFISISLIMVALSIRRPAWMLYGILIYLPFMGFFRRALIPSSGWSSFDPLVILAPSMVMLLGSYWVYWTYLRRQGVPKEKDTRLFKLVRWMIFIDMIQIVNPLQGSILTGLGGVIFYVVPLFWMVLTRMHFNARWISVIYGTVCTVGVVSALYGLKQIFYGFSSFENQWIDIANYAALMVSQTESRAFSFFTNGAEYTIYLVMAIVIAWVLLLRGTFIQKVIAIVILPLLFYGMFLQSVRTPVILTAFSLSVLTIINAKKASTRWFTAILMSVALVGAFSVITKLDTSSSALIAHQVNGLANPLDQQHSTALIHVQMFQSGIIQGLSMPIGRGLGVTTLAGMKLSNNGASSEVDLSNMMISDGVIGGVIYALIILEALRLAFKEAKASSHGLIILGILLATLGSWSIGGNYSASAIIWLSIGYLDVLTLKRRRELLTCAENDAIADKQAIGISKPLPS